MGVFRINSIAAIEPPAEDLTLKARLPCVAVTAPIQSIGNDAPVANDEPSLLMVNEYGCLRWGLIRSAYYNKLVNESDVVDIYKEWKDTSEFLVLSVKAEVVTPSLTHEGSGQIGRAHV